MLGGKLLVGLIASIQILRAMPWSGVSGTTVFFLAQQSQLLGRYTCCMEGQEGVTSLSMDR